MQKIYVRSNWGSPHRRVVKDLLQRVFGGSSVAMVASLLETQPPTPDELDKLQRLLDGLRRKSPQRSTVSRQAEAES